MAKTRPLILEPGVVTFGHWCDACALPSRAECTIEHITETGVRRVATISVCTECDDWQREAVWDDPSRGD